MECDIGLIIAIVGTGITFIAAMIAMFLWTRGEARSDFRHMENKIEKILSEIKDEMKDFHSRLLVLEERYLRLREKE